MVQKYPRYQGYSDEEEPGSPMSFFISNLYSIGELDTRPGYPSGVNVSLQKSKANIRQLIHIVDLDRGRKKRGREDDGLLKPQQFKHPDSITANIEPESIGQPQNIQPKAIEPEGIEQSQDIQP